MPPTSSMKFNYYFIFNKLISYFIFICFFSIHELKQFLFIYIYLKFVCFLSNICFILFSSFISLFFIHCRKEIFNRVFLFCVCICVYDTFYINVNLLCIFLPRFFNAFLFSVFLLLAINSAIKASNFLRNFIRKFFFSLSVLHSAKISLR